MVKRTILSKSLMIAFGSTTLCGGVAFAQQTPTPAPTELQRVEITGSSIKRVAAEGALPVTTVTKEDIQRSGVTTVEALIQTITSSSTANSFQGSALAGLATYGISSVSLRGLGDQRTLVLVNGRRLSVFAGTGGGVDVNAIPLSAIDRVEILRDGASALYGSDAVGGVVNFILRSDYKGMEVGASYDDPTRGGGGRTKKANVLIGFGNLSEDRYNAMLSAEVSKGSALFGASRDFAKTGNIAPFIKSAATESGRIEGIWVSGQTAGQNARNATTNPFGYSSSGYGNPSAPDNCAAINMFSSGKGGVGGKFDNCKFDSGPFVGLFPATEQTNLIGSLKFQITPNLQIFGDALYARNKVTETYQPSPVRVAFLSTDNAFTGSGVDPALLIRPANPAYTSIVTPYLLANGLGALNGQTLAVTARAFLAGPRTEQDINTQTRFVGGVKGNFADWDYEIALTANQSKTEGGLIDGYFSQLELARTINDPTNNWNPWAAGGVQEAGLTAKLQGAKYVGPTVSGLSKSNSIDAVTSGTIATLPAGPLQLAAGLSVRRDSYKISVPDILGTGDIAGLGGATLPVDASRTVTALFSELNVPILKDLEGNVAVRGDRYSDVGSTQNTKASLRYAATPNLLFRGSAGSGFRAPGLVELHQPQSVQSTEQFTDPAFPADGQIQPNAIRSGNTNLQPEKSKQFALGVGFQPLSSVYVGLDWYQIKIKNLIVVPAALSLVKAARAGTPLYGPSDVTFAPDGTVDTVDQTNRNAASANVEGVDLEVRWKEAFSFGKLSATLNGSYVTKYDYATLNGTQGSVGTIIQPDGSPLDVAGLGVVVRWKHNLAFNWTTGPWSMTLVQNYYRGYHDAPNQIDGAPHDVESLTLYDAQVAFTGVKNLTVGLGVKNIFDKNPPLAIGNGSSFQSGYDPTMYDARARTVYVKANYKFF